MRLGIALKSSRHFNQISLHSARPRFPNRVKEQRPDQHACGHGRSRDDDPIEPYSRRPTVALCSLARKRSGDWTLLSSS